MKKFIKLLFGIGLVLPILAGCGSQSDNDNNSSDDSKTAPTDDHPVFSEDGKSLTYGYYPQSAVTDEETKAGLNALKSPTSNGWYEYKGNYYIKMNAMPYGNHYKFNDGTQIESGKSYWFKCEPISWNVLSFKNGQYLIVSTLLLDTCNFYSSLTDRTIGGKTIYPNNYEHSDVRKFLNDDFYSTAFKLNSSYIKSTSVDNTGSTTYHKSNPYVCNDTNDNVFLLSYKDYNETYYKYDVDRARKTSDFTKARGARVNSLSQTFSQCANYWSRSPYIEKDYASIVTDGGSISPAASVEYTHYCIRPAMTIKVT